MELRIQAGARKTLSLRMRGWCELLWGNCMLSALCWESVWAVAAVSFFPPMPSLDICFGLRGFFLLFDCLFCPTSFLVEAWLCEDTRVGVLGSGPASRPLYSPHILFRGGVLGVSAQRRSDPDIPFCACADLTQLFHPHTSSLRQCCVSPSWPLG